MLISKSVVLAKRCRKMALVCLPRDTIDILKIEICVKEYGSYCTSVFESCPVLLPNDIAGLSSLLQTAGPETRSYISRRLGLQVSSAARTLMAMILEDSLHNLYRIKCRAPKFQSSCFVEP